MRKSLDELEVELGLAIELGLEEEVGEVAVLLLELLAAPVPLVWNPSKEVELALVPIRPALIDLIERLSP